MDEALWDTARQHAYGSLGLDPDPELGFEGVRGLRELADFGEAYQVRRLRQAGYSWAQIASWAGVTAQALHKKHSRGGTPGSQFQSEVPAPPTATSELWDARDRLV